MTTLVTIPEIMSDGRTWGDVSEVIKSRVAAVHGADTTQNSTLEAMASRAVAETDGDLIVVAHSMGGRVAMEMGRQAPERIKAMVLASTGHKSASADEEPMRLARIAEGNAGMAEYARNWVPKVLSKANARNETLVASIREMVEDCSAQVHERQNRALLARPDASPYLGEFTFPVLLITGEDDHLSTEASHGEIAGLLKDAESIVIEGAGHLLPFEQPQTVTSTILDWLDRRNIAPL